MKISIIGAGNVGSLTAMRLAQENLGDIVLVDLVKGLALGKALDLEDAQPLLKYNYSINGVDDIAAIKDSGIIIITAGLPRKPGMTREELTAKNAQILKDVCLNVKKFAPEAIIIVVTNPLDIMTYYALKITGFKSNRVLGMGVSLDSARFANLIAQELKLPVSDIEALVIGSHGEGMLPLVDFTKVKGVALDEFISDEKINSLVAKTVGRGAEIVANLGSGSAFFAPSAAIADLVRAIVKNEKRVIGACALLNGEYGINGSCVGVPCRLGSDGVEKVIELDLSNQIKQKLLKAAEFIRQSAEQIPL